MFNQFPTNKAILTSQKGMSLIEILIALTLLVVAGTLVGGQVLDSLDEGKISSAKIQIGNLKGVLKNYKRKCGSYPTTDQGLDALIAKPTGGKECKRYPENGFLEESQVPMDPWDQEYIYESDGRKFVIKSNGPDFEEETEDDINSDQLKK